VNCDDQQDLIVLYAAGALEDSEQQELRQHLASGCAVCAGRLAEAEALLANMPLALPAQMAPIGAREKLLIGLSERMSPADQVEPARSVSARSVPARKPARLMRFAPWLAAAATLLAGSWLGATTYSLSLSVKAQSQEITDLRKYLVERKEQNRALQAEVAQLRQRVQQAENGSPESSENPTDLPELMVVELRGTNSQPAAAGRVVWDHANSVWILYANRLKPTAADQAYQLWFVTTEGKQLSIGTFQREANGTAMLQAVLPEQAMTLDHTAVTLEPVGGSPQPTGKIQLWGGR
jgi:hypothetical protein